MRKKPPQATGPVAAALKRLGDEYLRETAPDALAARAAILTALGDDAAKLLAALAPEHRGAVALIAIQKIYDGEPVGDIEAWLSVKVLDQRRAHEAAVKTAAAQKAGSRSGARGSTAARRAPWQAWRDWIRQYAPGKDPANIHPNTKNWIVEVMRFRCGAPGQEPSRNDKIPDDLPLPRGHAGPPSEQVIRQNLFGSRSKY